MTRCIVSVGTGQYARGVARLKKLAKDPVMAWTTELPAGSPSHRDTPYGFKAYALEIARKAGYELVLWADASIKPVRSMEPLWDLIEKQGYWFSANWWPNGEWCSDASLPLLGITREEAMGHMHVAATSFGLNLRSDEGNGFLDDYMRYARNGAFRGPWKNERGEASADPRVRGHRHDQTAASAICWRRGFTLTNPPTWFAYSGHESPETVLSVDGRY